MLTPNEVVKEVSIIIEQDNICYIHKASREITTFPIADLKKPEVAAAIAKIEEKMIRYIKVKPMPNQTLLIIMEKYLDEITDKDVKRELKVSMQRKNPTRNYLQVVNSRYDIKQHWSLFRAEECYEYVAKEFVREYNY